MFSHVASLAKYFRIKKSSRQHLAGFLNLLSVGDRRTQVVILFLSGKLSAPSPLAFQVRTLRSSSSLRDFSLAFGTEHSETRTDASLVLVFPEIAYVPYHFRCLRRWNGSSLLFSWLSVVSPHFICVFSGPAL